jgi:nucleoside-diphosphate-sugar epimerase
MRILIAGCGYVGVRLAGLLSARGHEVFALRRNPPPGEQPFTWLAGDLTRPDAIDFPASIDLLILAAGLQRGADVSYAELLESGYMRLIAYLRNTGHPLQRVVMISTTGVFAECEGDWVDEDAPAGTISLSGTHYHRAEMLVASHGIPSVIARLSGIYGPGRIRLIREAREGRAVLYPPPPHYLNHIHADDAAAAVAHLALHPKPQPLYIVSDREPADRNDVMRWLANELVLPPPPEAAPGISAPPRRSGNKRCRSDLLVASGYSFIYPTYREGYRALLGEALQ